MKEVKTLFYFQMQLGGTNLIFTFDTYTLYFCNLCLLFHVL